MNVSDLRVTGIDGGFLVSFIDSIGPRFVVVPLGQFMSSRSAQLLPFTPAPNLVAPAPSEPPSFIASDNTLKYYLSDAGQFRSQPIDTQTSPRLLVAPNAFAVMARSTGVHTVPIGGGQVRSRVFDAGLPLGLAVHEDAGVLFASSSGNATLLPLDISPTGEATTGLLFELKSGAPQRAPTAIWSSAANLFLVAWEQRSAAGFEVRLRRIDRVGNASAPQPISAAPLPGGLDPRLLEAPDGGGVAIQLRVSTDAGLQTAVSLVNPTTLALGPTFGAFSAQDRVLYHPVSVVWAQTNPTAVRGMGTLPFPAPRCVAGAGGRAWFSGIGNNQLVVSTVPSGGSIIVTPSGPIDDAPGCAAVGRNGTVMVAARAGPSIHLAHVDTRVLFIDQRNLQTLVTGDPVVTALGDGFLVAWPSGTNILAFEVKSPPITWVPITIGPVMGEVRDLAATSAPSGEALLMWHAFDAQRGHSVWARVVSVPGFDGGNGLDGGFGVVDAGFGLVDAGLAGDGGVVAEDGGVVVADGGVVTEDAGVVVVDGGVVAEDGGVVIVDAGAAVDGGPGEVEFVPVCGCSAVDPRLVALLALVALTRRRGREAARDVFR